MLSTLILVLNLSLLQATLPCMHYPEWPQDEEERARREARKAANRPPTAQHQSRCTTAATIKAVQPRMATPDSTINQRPMPARLSNKINIVAS